MRTIRPILTVVDGKVVHDTGAAGRRAGTTTTTMTTIDDDGGGHGEGKR